MRLQRLGRFGPFRTCWLRFLVHFLPFAIPVRFCVLSQFSLLVIWERFLRFFIAFLRFRWFEVRFLRFLVAFSSFVCFCAFLCVLCVFFVFVRFSFFSVFVGPWRLPPSSSLLGPCRPFLSLLVPSRGFT